MTVEIAAQQPVSVLALLGERLTHADTDPLGYERHASLAYDALISKPGAAKNKALFEVIGEGACLFNDPVSFQAAWPEVESPMGEWRLRVAAAESGHDDWVTLPQRNQLDYSTRTFCVASANRAVAMAEACLYKLKIELAQPHNTPYERSKITSAIGEFKQRAAENIDLKATGRVDTLRFAAAQSLLARGATKAAENLAGDITDAEIWQQFAELAAKARARRKTFLPIQQFFTRSLGNSEAGEKADGNGGLTALRGLARHVAYSFQQSTNAGAPKLEEKTPMHSTRPAIEPGWQAHAEALLDVGDLKSAREMYRGGMFGTLQPVSELDLRLAWKMAACDNAQPDINIDTVEQLGEFPYGSRRLEAGLRLAEKTGADDISEALRQELVDSLTMLRRVAGAQHSGIDPETLADFGRFGVTPNDAKARIGQEYLQASRRQSD